MKDSKMPYILTVFSALMNILVISIIGANYAMGYSYPFNWFNVFVYWFGATVVNLLGPTFNMANHPYYISVEDNHDDTVSFKV